VSNAVAPPGHTDTRARVAATVNSGLTLLYWRIGQRICKDILLEKRAEYGAEIVAGVARQLKAEFDRGLSRSNLFNKSESATRAVAVKECLKAMPTGLTPNRIDAHHTQESLPEISPTRAPQGSIGARGTLPAGCGVADSLGWLSVFVRNLSPLLCGLSGLLLVEQRMLY
jgi:hypothetical protein